MIPLRARGISRICRLSRRGAAGCYGGASTPLVIVIDDIARTADPVHTLRRICGWATQLSRTTIFVVPVWPDVFRQLFPESSSGQRPEWLCDIRIGGLTHEEAASVIRKARPTITDAEMSSILGHLGLDPFIVGLYAELLATRSASASPEFFALANDVCEQFVQREIEEAAKAPGSPYIAADLKRALNALAQWILKHRRFQPLWEDLCGALDNNVSPLRALVQREKLLRVSDADGAILLFRHDRFRDALLAKAVAPILQSTSPPDFVYDPTLVQLVGQALAGTDISDEPLNRIRKMMPLALFAGLRFIGEPTHEREHILANVAIEWLNEHKTNLPESMRDFIAWQLVDTDSSFVERVLNVGDFGFPGYLAGTRNGVALSAIRYLHAHRTSDTILPSAINDVYRDRVLAHALARHESRLRSEIKRLFHTPRLLPWAAKGSLSLLGLLGLRDFDNELEDVFDTHRIGTCVDARDDLLPDLLWAALRCHSGSDRDLLGEIFQALERSTAFDDANCFRSRDHLIRELAWSVGMHTLSEAAITRILRELDRTPSERLRRDLCELLDRVDHPEAIKRVVTESAKRATFSAGSDKRRELSNASRQCLVEIWRNEQNQEERRAAAFEMWLGTVTRKDLEVLREAEKTGLFWKKAFHRRVELGDAASVARLIQLLQPSDKDSFVWLNLLDHVWCQDIFDQVAKILTSSRRYDLVIANLLRRIPTADAESLLISHWHLVGSDIRYIHAAFALGTKRCLELAAKSIATLPPDVYPFEHIGTHLAHPLGGGRKIGLAQLEGLEPYLGRLNSDDAFMMAHAALGAGCVEWARRHLAHRLDRRLRARDLPGEEDVEYILDNCQDSTPLSLHYLHGSIETLKRCGLKEECIADIAIEWMKTSVHEHRDRIGVECVKTVGSRKHLAVLAQVLMLDTDASRVLLVDAEFAVMRRSPD